jgi:transcription elongation factor Elf1
MPSRRKLNWDKINELQMTTCLNCNSKMQIADCKRVDGEHLVCPRCGITQQLEMRNEKYQLQGWNLYRCYSRVYAWPRRSSGSS